MAANEFLPFGNGVGANVLSQAAYAALTARATGFASGRAPSAEINKVLRQSALMTAALAIVIADAGEDPVDDGNAVALAAKLSTAIAALGSGSAGLALLAAANMFTRGQTVTPQPGVITSIAGTYTPNAQLSNTFFLELQANGTLANPTNLANGQLITVKVAQNATGGWVLSTGSVWTFPTGEAGFGTLPNEVTMASGIYDSTANKIFATKRSFG